MPTDRVVRMTDADAEIVALALVWAARRRKASLASRKIDLAEAAATLAGRDLRTDPDVIAAKVAYAATSPTFAELALLKACDERAADLFGSTPASAANDGGPR